MITVGDILGYLCGKYPPDTACDFDNVGLLIGDKNQTVTGALVCLDFDKGALVKALKEGCELIITHHPVIFDPLKSITAESLVYRAIRAGVSVISMHTNLDIGEGGVNDRLCEALKLQNITPFTAEDGYLLKCGSIAPIGADDLAQQIKKQLGGGVKYVSGDRMIERVLVCSGSGGGYLSEALSGGFDALITADVKHNVFVDAINYGISLFDAGHYDTEKVICEPLSKELKENFGDIEFIPYTHKMIKTA